MPVLAGLIGESVQGSCTLRVKDFELRDTGSLEKWKLILRCELIYEYFAFDNCVDDKKKKNSSEDTNKLFPVKR